MLKLSRNGIGLLTAQYRSVLRKCLLLNMFAAGVMAFSAPANATVYDSASTPRFQYMGMSIYDGDTAYVYGSEGYNLKEVINDGGGSSSDTHNDAWLRNKGNVFFGYNTSGTQLDSTVVSHKHNITVLNGLAINGGGVIANMNNDSSNTSLNIYRTEFNDNSATRFLNEFGNKDTTGISAGGALSNYSANQAEVVTSSFNENYTMHFNQAAGGAIYNGSNALYGTNIVLGSIRSTGGSTFVNNHAGNELMEYSAYVEGEPSQVESKILDVWKNNSSNTSTGDLSTLATGGAIHNEGSYISNNDRFEYNHAIGITSKGGAIYNDKNSQYPDLGDFGGEINLDGIVTFVGNYAGQGKSATGSTVYATIANGGAIYNDGELNIHSGDASNMIYFGNDESTAGSAGNFTIATSGAEGGAIFNDTDGVINAIRSNSIFKQNYSRGIGSGNALGGAIANYGQIALEGGSFTNNYASSDNGSAQGGAIFNGPSNGTNGKITIDIAQNTLFSGNSAKEGGAIYNRGIIDGAISSNALLQFTGNSASATSGGVAMGNSIYNDSGASVSIQLTDNAQIHFANNQSVYNAGSMFRIAGSNDIPVELGSSVVSAMSGDNTSVLLDTTLYSAPASTAYNISRTNLILSSTGYIDTNTINSSALNDTALNLTNNNIKLQSGSYMNLNSGNDSLANNDFSVDANSNLRYKNQNGNTSYLANTITNNGTVTYYGYNDNSDVYVAKALVNSNTLNAAADGLLTNIHIDNLKSKDGNQIVVNLNNPSGNPSASQADIIVIDKTIHNDANTTTKVVFNDLANNYLNQVYLGTDDKIYFAKT
ncbi:MAG: hypothetical protein IJ677_01375, partial [Alphaproteobacteria bacterium]|nr:hypothetical protein [Alphaproteobacteria bacterium]